MGNGLPIDYIVCTDPAYAGMIAMHARALDAGWHVEELPTGHDVMVSALRAKRPICWQSCRLPQADSGLINWSCASSASWMRTFSFTTRTRPWAISFSAMG